MTKRKYFSWTDEKRAELREFVNGHSDIREAFKEAAVLFGVSEQSCISAYKYEPKRLIVTEVDPSELEPRKTRIMEGTLETFTQPRELPMYTECEIEILDGEEEYVIRHLGDKNLMIKVGGTVILLKLQESPKPGFLVTIDN